MPPSPSTPARESRRMSGFALLSFCLALITLPLNALSRIAHVPLGFLSCVAAVICGHLALKQIRTQSNMGGRGYALAGLIIGYIAIALTVTSAVYLIYHPNGTIGTNTTSVTMEPRPAETPITTNPNTVEIPAQAVTGTVEKIPFTLKQAELESDTLHLRDDANDPNSEVLILLSLQTNEPLNGLKRIVPGQTPAPHIHLRWKEGASRRSVALTAGYVMHLEFGQRNGTVIPGKVYLELPSSYGTKLSGTFEATVK